MKSKIQFHLHIFEKNEFEKICVRETPKIVLVINQSSNFMPKYMYLNMYGFFGNFWVYILMNGPKGDLSTFTNLQIYLERLPIKLFFTEIWLTDPRP